MGIYGVRRRHDLLGCDFEGCWLFGWLVWSCESRMIGSVLALCIFDLQMSGRVDRLVFFIEMYACLLPCVRAEENPLSQWMRRRESTELAKRA